MCFVGDLVYLVVVYWRSVGGCVSSCGPTDLPVVGETGDLIQRRVFCCVHIIYLVVVIWTSVGGCVDLGQVLAVLSCCVLRRAVLSFGSVYWGCWMSLVLFMRSLFNDFVFFVWLWFCLSLIVWRGGVFIEILWKFWVLVVFARVLFTLVVSHYDCLWFKVFHCLRLLEDFAHLLSVRELVSTPVFVHY